MVIPNERKSRDRYLLEKIVASAVIERNKGSAFPGLVADAIDEAAAHIFST